MMNLTTEQCVQSIAERIKNRLPFIDELKWLARQDPGSFYITNGQEWQGINDKLGNNGYFRYMPQFDHEYGFPVKKLTSAPTVDVKANIRFVFMHRCTNEDEIEMSLWNELMLTTFTTPIPGYTVMVRRSTKDKQRIVIEENGLRDDQGTTDMKWNIVSFDLELTYNATVNSGAACIPKCENC